MKSNNEIDHAVQQGKMKYDGCPILKIECHILFSLVQALTHTRSTVNPSCYALQDNQH